MSDKVFVPEHWYRDYSRAGYCYVKAGNYEIAVEPEVSNFISDREAVALIDELNKSGLIQPRLDERLRTEDLKITHRILDILDKAIR